jgi:hypothetical protein
MALKLHTQLSFTQEIERLVEETCASYLEVVSEYIQEHQIDPKVVPNLLNQEIRFKIEKEATDLNMINRGKKKLRRLD